MRLLVLTLLACFSLNTLAADTKVQAGRGGTAVNVQGDHNTVTIRQSGIAPEVLIDLAKKLGVAENERDAWMQRYQDLERQLAERHDDLAKRAEALLKKGELDQAEALFEKALQNDLKNAAANAYSLAQINDLRYKTPAAINYARRAAELDSDNIYYWELLGNLQLRVGNLAQAESAFRRLLRLTAVASETQPGESSLLRNLSVSYEKIGIIQQAQGDLPGALASFRSSLTIAEKLSRLDPANSQWQRNLSVSYDRIGNIQQAQGDLPGALVSYRNSLTIREKLARLDSANSEWQRDLSVSYNKIGTIQQAQGDLPGALASFRNSLTIREKLARLDPANSLWQNDLSISLERVGGIQQAQGDLTGALATFQRKQSIDLKLTQLDAANTKWQRDLSISYNNIGTIQQAQGDLPGALVSFRNGLTIAEKLARLDPANVQWQTDLAWSCGLMSDVTKGAERQGYLQRGLAVLLRLDKENRLTAEQKNRWIPMFQAALKQP